MPTYRGYFRYGSGNDSSPEHTGGCQIQFDTHVLTLTPDAGTPLTFDLGDVDAVLPQDYALGLTLFTGATLTLYKLGKSYDTAARELMESYRARILECLLLADLQPIDCCSGEFTLTEHGAPGAPTLAEFRIFESNLAVLPGASQAFQWRLADVDALRVDRAQYAIEIEAGERVLRIARLGPRTEQCHTTLRDAIGALKEKSSAALHSILPFLNADDLRNITAVLREGRSVSFDRLAAVHPRVPGALAATAVDDALRPYYEDLLSRTARGVPFAGFKLIRTVNDGMPDSDTEAEAPDNAALYWFFFPIAVRPGSAEPRNVAAWEASSRAGRATYFFSLLDPSDASLLDDPARAQAAVDRGIDNLTRGLGVLNYRRRPIYLSDDEMTGQADFHRYAIAARRIPEVRQLRAAFLGRATHGSLQAWRDQVNRILDDHR